MEMSQAERKKLTTIQFEPAEMAEIVAVQAALLEKEGLSLSKPKFVMYAIKQLKKKLS